RIEIVRGPAGALFGANASRGVIAISTRKASEAGGLAVAGFGDRATHYARVSHASRIQDEWYLKVVGSWEESHTFETPAAGIRPGKGLVRGVGRVHARRALGEDRSLEVILGLVEARKTTRVSPPGAIDGLTFYEASLLYEAPGTRLRSSWNGMEAEAALGSSLDLIKQKKGILTFERDVHQDDDLALMAGFDLRFLHLKSRVSVAGAKDDLMAAVFARLETHLGVGLSAHATARLEKEPARDRLHLVPNLSLVQELGDSHSVRITAGRGFRNPGSVATYGDFPFLLSSGPIRILGNRDLDPEKQDTVEFGYEARFGDRFSLSAAVFHNWLHDLIANRLASPTPPPVLRFANMATGRTFGVELETRFSPWTEGRCYVGYAFLDSRGSAEELTTPHTLKAGLTARFLDRGIVDLNYSLLSDRREEPLGALAPPPGSHGTSHFLSARLSYRLWRNGPEIGLNVWNALDQDEAELFGAGEPERRVSLDLRMDF
ncbi:MAG: TonB-dependent receptor plug domain-containing protein, partial [Planctomycetota bacterium]